MSIKGCERKTISNVQTKYIPKKCLHLMNFFREMITLITEEVETESQEMTETIWRTGGDLGPSLSGNAFAA